jgi:cbb3-type cytochrome oxidase maturation protein
MSIIFLILPATLLLCLAAVGAFAWATRSGQFDDLETPALRLLHDDCPAPEQEGKNEAAAARGPIDPKLPSLL